VSGPAVRVVLLAGLGADGRLFEPQRRAWPGLETPAWIAPTHDETLAGYAERFGGLLGLEDAGRLILGGASFGGMVALEMARHVRTAGVVLMGSSRGGLGAPGRLRYLEMLTRMVPESLEATAAGPLLQAFAGLERISVEQRMLLAAMAAAAPIRFVRWGSRACVEWMSGAGPEIGDVPIHQIHGRRDWIIPPAMSGAKDFIEDGGHMINLTHAEEVNAVLMRAIQG